MAKDRVITVVCRCGQPLFKYYKGGRGRLIKCYLDQIRTDHVGIHHPGLRESRDQDPQAPPTCPSCGRSLGRIQIIRGRPALKINQGTVRETRI
jgi:hypothetical protein